MARGAQQLGKVAGVSDFQIRLQHSDSRRSNQSQSDAQTTNKLALIYRTFSHIISAAITLRTRNHVLPNPQQIDLILYISISSSFTPCPSVILHFSPFESKHLGLAKASEQQDFPHSFLSKFAFERRPG